MAQPTYASQHYDQVLTNISVAYMQADRRFISQKVFPVVPVDKQSGIYFTYDRASWNRDEAAKRADSTESVGSGYSTGQDSYSADLWAIHKDVGDQIIANATSPLAPLSDAAKYVMSRLALRQELDFANTYFKPGVWANDFTGVAAGPTGNQFVQWNDFVNSNPLEDVDAMKESIEGKTGFDVNTIVMGKLLFNKMKNHPDIIDRIKYTDSRVVTPDLLARYFEVDKVLIARSIVNTAKEGQAESTSYVFNNKGLWMGHAATSPGLLTPSAGYTFSWTGVSGVNGLTVATSQIRIEIKKTTRIESEAAWVNKVVAADLGAYAASVIA